jgi:saccharopine dehydrogenase (NAD+, L-lysine-forming)
LKELDIEDDRYFMYKNIYFSHSFKFQNNSGLVLDKFIKKGGKILDYEYIIGKNGKRMIAFGYWAGYIGAYLGINQYIRRMNNWKDLSDIDKLDKETVEGIGKIEGIKIGIIGVNGRCGGGCIYLLEKYGVDYKGYGRGDNMEDIYECDIIINCVCIDRDSDFVLIDKNNKDRYRNLKVLVDVSCDIYSKNNPIRLDYNLTDFKNPVFKYEKIDIIAIDNLSSLMPKESSNEFSNKLTHLLQNKNVWEKLEEIYEKIIHLKQNLH